MPPHHATSAYWNCKRSSMLFATSIHSSAANTFWSTRTTQQWWHTSTARAARAPLACASSRGNPYLWSWDHHVSLQAVHIPSIDNSIGEGLSWGKIRPTERSFQRGVPEHLFAETEKPNKSANQLDGIIGLCLPPDISSQLRPLQTQEGTLSSPSHSSILATSTAVPPTHPPPHGNPNCPPQQAQTSSSQSPASFTWTQTTFS